MEESKKSTIEMIRIAFYYLLAMISIGLAVFRVFSQDEVYQRVDYQTLLFFAAAAIFILLERVKKINIGKDGIEAEFVEKFKDIQEIVRENTSVIASGIGGKQKIQSKGVSKALTNANLINKEILDPTDPQKGRFGGKSVNNERKISASVIPSKSSPGNYKIKLKVESTNSSNRLQGNVVFYLHNTFTQNERYVKVQGGVAELDLIAYGAFTVGAVADNGNTLLELDLSQDEDFPYEFRIS